MKFNLMMDHYNGEWRVLNLQSGTAGRKQHDQR